MAFKLFYLINYANEEKIYCKIGQHIGNIYFLFRKFLKLI